MAQSCWGHFMFIFKHHMRHTEELCWSQCSEIL